MPEKRKSRQRKSVSSSNESTQSEELKTPSVVIDLKEEPTVDKEIIFKPNKGPQTTFLAAPEREVLFGGAAGGGKSMALLADAMRDLNTPGFSGLILRRTTEELRDLIVESQSLYPKAIKGIKWRESEKTWKTPNGGRLWMSYLENDRDVTRYQGQAFNYIGFDELTQWPTPYAWDYMRSRLRSTSGLPLYMRATTNPGNSGHMWVKKMFIDPSPDWGKSFWATDIETGKILRWPETHSDPEKAGKPLFKRRFIPSRLSDNPYLYNDGVYESNLLSMNESQRKRLLEGDWDIVEGGAFPEWNRELHVIEPFEIPKNWKRFRSCDYGYSDWTSVLWFAVSPSDQLIVYRELHVKGVEVVELAKMVLDREEGERISYGVLDSSLWFLRGESGISPAVRMMREGCRWRPSSRRKGSREAGKNEFHRRLKVDEFTGEPGIVFFTNCINAISNIPALLLDKNNPEDVDTKMNDHDYDAVRYGIMTNPTSGHQDSFGGFQKTTQGMVDSVFGY